MNRIHLTKRKPFVSGNVFVIAAILLERNLQNVANYLIVSLAVADLMVACLVMPLGAVYVVSAIKDRDNINVNLIFPRSCFKEKWRKRSGDGLPEIYPIRTTFTSQIVSIGDRFQERASRKTFLLGNSR